MSRPNIWKWPGEPILYTTRINLCTSFALCIWIWNKVWTKMLNTCERERERPQWEATKVGGRAKRERECSDKVKLKFGSHSHRSDIKIFPWGVCFLWGEIYMGKQIITSFATNINYNSLTYTKLCGTCMIRCCQKCKISNQCLPPPPKNQHMLTRQTLISPPL